MACLVWASFTSSLDIGGPGHDRGQNLRDADPFQCAPPEAGLPDGIRRSLRDAEALPGRAEAKSDGGCSCQGWGWGGDPSARSAEDSAESGAASQDNDDNNSSNNNNNDSNDSNDDNNNDNNNDNNDNI